MIGIKYYDLSGSQFFILLITKIQERKALKAGTESTVFFCNNHRCTSHFISGSIDALRDQQKNGHGSVDQFLRILNSFYQVFFLVDDGSYKLCRVDISTAHFQKMSICICKDLVADFFCVINFSNCGDRKCTVMRTNDQRLRLIV